MEKENQIKIALIEDHQGLRKSLQKIFEACNFTVVMQADNGQAAIDSLEVQDLMPDICVLDINMPIMDGFQTAKEIAQKYPQIKILVLSSHDYKTSIREMLRLGVRGYVLKGSSPEKLKTAVLKLYEGGYYFSETVSKTALSYLAENRNFR